LRGPAKRGDLSIEQVRGFAPIGMLEKWNIGKMGFGILEYWVNDPQKAER
jgi:hypothetical protein